ncbi:hypothetical protein OH76DRAFT_450 [Lentinus brumalis]|uniref:Uncharacterized protein n=1 Tax=Lentinus brumalis TaxID=2498619 RepID=A0A371DWK1_9APHY|nr:hypothetical protein OH76DRAFT_450 [Polyporus brumalis]
MNAETAASADTRISIVRRHLCALTRVRVLTNTKVLLRGRARICQVTTSAEPEGSSLMSYVVVLHGRWPVRTKTRSGLCAPRENRCVIIDSPSSRIRRIRIRNLRHTWAKSRLPAARDVVRLTYVSTTFSEPLLKSRFSQSGVRRAVSRCEVPRSPERGAARVSPIRTSLVQGADVIPQI